MPIFTVNVGNIGKVHESESHPDALKDFREYKEQSKLGRGRAAHESIVLSEDGEPILEYHPTNKLTIAK